MNILIIEDDTSVQMALAAIMKQKGHDVICVDNGEDALAAATGDNDIDLIISDGEFFGDMLCTGPETIKAIQECGVILPTLFFSANQAIIEGAQAQKEAGLIKGDVSFLMKPQSNATIVAAIDKIAPGFQDTKGMTNMRPIARKNTAPKRAPKG